MAISNSTSGGNNAAVIILAVIVVALLAVGAVYMMQDHRTGGERLGDAVQTLPKGLDKAAKKLDDQPPAQNVERNLDDAAKKVQ